MRKIKITALLLAVLMIVTAFAGCASKSTVTNLDNKVNDLDASIEEQKAALSGIESTLATISKALENQGSSDNLDEVIKDIEENEKNVADIAGALKDLQAAIEDLKKEPATQAPVVSGDLETAINQYSAKLEALAGKVEDDKANYTAEALTAIRELVGEAETKIENAADKAAAEAAYKAFEDKLADKAFMSVNGKLYAYVLELKGNITDASADKVDEAVEALGAALKFYKCTEAAPVDALKAYEVGEDDTINLVAAINDLHNDQYIKLPSVKADAAVIDEQIADIDASYTFADVTAILSTYKLWEKDAKALSPENVKLVKNYDALLKAHTSALNSDTAKIIFNAGKVESVLYATYGQDLDVFSDYVELLVAGEQVLFVFDTEKKDADGNKVPASALTSKIYDAIDAWVADWAKEYGLTDLAVETIINAWAKAELPVAYADNFYAKYNSDKALVKAFEAESKTLADGIFKNIKALNAKKLGADAVEVLNAYKKNADDINAWRKALVDAYDAELLAISDERDTRNIWNTTLYEAALEANFNAMVEEAELCVYHEKTSTTPAYYEAYGLGFLADVKDDSNNNAYYHKLYDFKNADMVDFLRVTYKAADAAAEVINNRIKNFKTAQAHSIATIAANIGGYVELVGNELVAVKDTAIVAAAAGTPDTIAEFIYKYKTAAKYDLSSMINVAGYEAKIAEIEKNIKAADAALADLDNAYGKWLKTDGIVTLSDKAQITALYGLLTKWMSVGHVEMAIATEAKTAPNGVKEYKLTNLLDRYNNITAAELDTTPANMSSVDGSTSIIILDKYRVDQLQKEADLAVSAYTVMDKVYAFHNSNSFSFDNHAVHSVATSVIGGTRNHFASNGVVSVTNGAAMTADGTDSLGRAYKQGQSLWTVEYVVLGGSGSTPKFTTKKLEGYYFSNYTDATAANNGLADAKNADGSSNVNKDLAKLMFVTSAQVSNLPSYVNYVFNTIPNTVISKNVTELYAAFGSGAKVLPNFILPMIVTTIDSRFMVNNYNEEYAALTKARANWDPENGGYGFNYVKGLTYAYVDNNDAVTASNKAAVNKATDVESLRIAAKACLVDITGTTDAIVFGGVTGAQMTPLFKSTKVLADPAEDVAALVIYKECDHTAVAATLCVGTYVKCDECSELVWGTKAHTVPTGVTACNGYNCVDCGVYVAPVHTYNGAISVVTLWVTSGATFETGALDYTYACVDCAEPVNGATHAYTFVDVDASASLTTGDTIEFTVEIDGTDYTVTATYDAAANAWN
jgi:archaellum component FlaC